MMRVSTRRLLTFLCLSLCFGVGVRSTHAQELTQTGEVVFAGGTITFSYPEGWLLSEAEGGAVLTNSTEAEEQIRADGFTSGDDHLALTIFTPDYTSSILDVGFVTPADSLLMGYLNHLAEEADLDAENALAQRLRESTLEGDEALAYSLLEYPTHSVLWIANAFTEATVLVAIVPGDGVFNDPDSPIFPILATFQLTLIDLEPTASPFQVTVTLPDIRYGIDLDVPEGWVHTVLENDASVIFASSQTVIERLTEPSKDEELVFSEDEGAVIILLPEGVAETYTGATLFEVLAEWYGADENIYMDDFTSYPTAYVDDPNVPNIHAMMLPAVGLTLVTTYAGGGFNPEEIHDRLATLSIIPLDE